MATRKKPHTPIRIELVNVFVSIDDAYLNHFGDIEKTLKSVGMRVEELHPITGTIVGAVVADDIPKLKAIQGVAAVEVEPEFHTH